MKNATFWVNLRTSSTASPEPCGEPTSNHSVSASLVVLEPTNWDAAEPRWSPAPGGLTSWLAKLTLSDSGLNWTVHQVSRLDLVLERRVELAQLSLGEVHRVGHATLAPARWLQLQRLVRDLQLLDGHHPVLGV